MASAPTSKVVPNLTDLHKDGKPAKSQKKVPNLPEINPHAAAGPAVRTAAP